MQQWICLSKSFFRNFRGIIIHKIIRINIFRCFCISIGAYFHDGSVWCALSKIFCGCTLTLQSIYIPLKIGWRIHCIIKITKRLIFRSFFHSSFLLWYETANKNQQQRRTSSSPHIFWQFCCCCGYRHTTLAHRLIVVRSSCQIRNDRIISTKTITTTTTAVETIDCPVEWILEPNGIQITKVNVVFFFHFVHFVCQFLDSFFSFSVFLAHLLICLFKIPFFPCSNRKNKWYVELRLKVFEMLKVIRAN